MIIYCRESDNLGVEGFIFQTCAKCCRQSKYDMIIKNWQEMKDKAQKEHREELRRIEIFWADIFQKRKQLLESGKAETVGIVNFLKDGYEKRT